jgi:pre-mRNA-splicing factor ATP-dependent RNA helicase DHX15/PRP43
MKQRLDLGQTAAPSMKKDKLIPGQTTTEQGKEAEEADYNHYTNAPYSQRYKDILAKRRTLPVHKQREEFLSLLHSNQIIIL